MIRFRCSACRQLLGAADSKSGYRITCPTCKGTVIVPVSSAKDASPSVSAGAPSRGTAAKRRPAKEEEVLEVEEVEEVEELEVVEDIEEVEEVKRSRRRKRRRIVRDDTPFMTQERYHGLGLVVGGLIALAYILSKADAYGASDVRVWGGVVSALVLLLGGLYKLVRG